VGRRGVRDHSRRNDVCGKDLGSLGAFLWTAEPAILLRCGDSHHGRRRGVLGRQETQADGSYEATDRLRTLTNPNSEVTTWSYDNAGGVTTQELGNGARATYSYDNASRTTGVTHRKADNTLISSFAYSYDNGGNRRTVTENSGDVVTWTYDNANQLTREQRNGANAYDRQYTYDNVGNRSTLVDVSGTTTSTYDTGNQLLTQTAPGSSVTTYSYDNAGNRTVTNAAGSVTTYAWDYDNHLQAVTASDGAKTTFTYDGEGLRRQAQTAATTAKFIWDDADVLLETNSGGTTQVSYTQTPDAYGVLVSQRRGATSSFYLSDALGSTTELTAADQATSDAYRYYAFGSSLTSSGSTTNPYRYVGNLGYYNESALGLQYLRARWYDPATGRFLSQDPAREGGNWYAYAANSPTIAVDPSGAAAECHYTLNFVATDRTRTSATLKLYNTKGALVDSWIAHNKVVRSSDPEIGCTKKNWPYGRNCMIEPRTYSKDAIHYTLQHLLEYQNTIDFGYGAIRVIGVPGRPGILIHSRLVDKPPRGGYSKNDKYGYGYADTQEIWRRATHGCIRMPNIGVKALWETIDPQMKVGNTVWLYVNAPAPGAYPGVD